MSFIGLVTNQIYALGPVGIVFKFSAVSRVGRLCWRVWIAYVDGRFVIETRSKFKVKLFLERDSADAQWNQRSWTKDGDRGSSRCVT